MLHHKVLAVTHKKTVFNPSPAIFLIRCYSLSQEELSSSAKVTYWYNAIYTYILIAEIVTLGGYDPFGWL